MPSSKRSFQNSEPSKPVRMMDDTSQIPMTIVATSNPWLNIPLDDYEGHMSLPEVGQAQMIADELHHAVLRWAPRSIAVIGCAGGNGLERIARGTVERVVAMDVNPDYVERTRARHAQ